MSGRDWQLPVGDRDHEDTRSERPARDLSPALPIQMPKGDEGFFAALERLAKDPAIVPVFECFECGDDFNHEPTVPPDAHVEESKRKGLTWCSVRCYRVTTR